MVGYGEKVLFSAGCQPAYLRKRILVIFRYSTMTALG